MTDCVHATFSLPPSGRLTISWFPQFPEPFEQFRLAIDQLGGILVLGSVVAPHELVGYKCECSLPFGAEAVVVRSNAPTVTEKLSVLIGGLFERFPHLYRLRIAEGKR